MSKTYSYTIKGLGGSTGFLLTVRGLEVSRPDQLCGSEVRLHLLALRIKLALTSMKELNVEHNEPVLCVCVCVCACVCWTPLTHFLPRGVLNYMTNCFLVDTFHQHTNSTVVQKYPITHTLKKVLKDGFLLV